MDCGGEAEPFLGDHEHAYRHQTGGVFKCTCGAAGLLAEPGSEAPLTPEEEEMAPEDPATLEASQAPDRRPPYAVAYSVSGRLFEILLPGDCSVRAEDGALVIRHPEPVNGITDVAPVRRAA